MADTGTSAGQEATGNPAANLVARPGQSAAAPLRAQVNPDGTIPLAQTGASLASVDVADVDLVLTFQDGSMVVIPNGALDALGGKPPEVLFADGAVGLNKLFNSVGATTQAKAGNLRIVTERVEAQPAEPQARQDSAPPALESDTRPPPAPIAKPATPSSPAASASAGGSGGGAAPDIVLPQSPPEVKIPQFRQGVRIEKQRLELEANNDAGQAIEAGGSSNAAPGVNASANVLVNDTADGPKTVTGVQVGPEGGAGASAAIPAGATASVTGSFGTLTMGEDGSYTYVVNEADPDVQALRVAGQTLSETFSYVIADETGETTGAELLITIDGRNDAPLGTNDVGPTLAIEAAGTLNGIAGVGIVGNVLANDTDVDSAANGELKFVVGVRTGSEAVLPGTSNGAVGSPLAGQYGELTLQSDGSYSYVVDDANAAVQALRVSGQQLSETFTYTVGDLGGLTDAAELVVTIDGRNDAPIGVNDAGAAVEAGFANGAVPATGSVLLNDRDPDSIANGEAIRIGAVRSGTELAGGATDAVAGGTTSADGTLVVGQYGSLTLGSDGSYTYVVDDLDPAVQALNNNQTLAETFTYTIVDALGLSDAAELTITINGRNDVPSTNPFGFDDIAAATESGGLANAIVGIDPVGNVLANDTPLPPAKVTDVRSGVETAGGAFTTVPDGGSTSIAGSYGQLTIGSDGQYSYAVDNGSSLVGALGAGQQVIEVFTYAVTDALGEVDTATLAITITGSNDLAVLGGTVSGGVTEDRASSAATSPPAAP